MTKAQEATEEKQRQLVDVEFDPITRIIGNLGIYTKVDFANQEVVECIEYLFAVPRLQRLHERRGPA